MNSTYTSQVGWTGKGNAVGMTSKGETICGRSFPKVKTHRVWIDSPFAMTDERTRNFGTYAEAKAYAASLIDETVTGELAWW